jgi:hypothetical protein
MWLFWEMMYADKGNHASSLNAVTPRKYSVFQVRSLWTIGSVAHTRSGHIVSVYALTLCYTDAGAVSLSASCIDGWERHLLLLQMDEMTHTSSSVNTRGLPDLGVSNWSTSSKLLDHLPHCFAMWDARFGKHFHKILFNLLCAFASTTKDVFHHKNSGFKWQHHFYSTCSRPNSSPSYGGRQWSRLYSHVTHTWVCVWGF